MNVKTMIALAAALMLALTGASAAQVIVSAEIDGLFLEGYDCASMEFESLYRAQLNCKAEVKYEWQLEYDADGDGSIAADEISNLEQTSSLTVGDAFKFVAEQDPGESQTLKLVPPTVPVSIAAVYQGGLGGYTYPPTDCEGTYYGGSIPLQKTTFSCLAADDTEKHVVDVTTIPAFSWIFEVD